MCPSGGASLCDETPPADYDTGVKLCARQPATPATRATPAAPCDTLQQLLQRLPCRCACSGPAPNRRRARDDGRAATRADEEKARIGLFPPDVSAVLEADHAARLAAAERAAETVARLGGCPSAKRALRLRASRAGVQPGLQPGVQPGLQPGLQSGVQLGAQPGAERGGRRERSILDSAAACPKAAAALVAARGGLRSDYADEAVADYLLNPDYLLDPHGLEPSLEPSLESRAARGAGSLAADGSPADEALLDRLLDPNEGSVDGPDGSPADGPAPNGSLRRLSTAPDAASPAATPPRALAGRGLWLAAAAAAVAVAALLSRRRRGLARLGGSAGRGGTMLGLLFGAQVPQLAEAHNWCVRVTRARPARAVPLPPSLLTLTI